jgi:hypothetical protein
MHNIGSCVAAKVNIFPAILDVVVDEEERLVMRTKYITKGGRGLRENRNKINQK